MGKRKGRDDMAAKSANLYARIEPDVKEQAEGILATLGIPASNAINMFYKQIILNRGLPFEVKIPTGQAVIMMSARTSVGLLPTIKIMALQSYWISIRMAITTGM